MKSGRNYTVVIQIIVLALLVFFAISWLMPSYWNWSILNPISKSPFRFVIFVLIGLTVFIPAIGKMILGSIDGFLNYLRVLTDRLPSLIRIMLVLIISAAALYLCRGFTYLYGDGHLIISHIESGSMISATAYGFSLLIKYSSKIFRVGGWFTPADFMAWISIICGVVYLYFLFKIISLLVSDVRLRSIFYLIAATSAIIILFTGYVETYSILTAWLALYFYYCLNYLRNKGHTAILVLIFAMGVFWHIWFAAFLPSLLFVLNKRYRILSDKFLILLSTVYVLGIIVSGSLIARSGIPPMIPVLNNSRTIYSLLSYHHIIDFLNILIVAGPIMILVGLILVFLHLGKTFNPDMKLLVFAGVPAFIIALFLDPALGAVRDWDVLSIFALPVILIGIVLLWQYLKKSPTQAYILVPILLLGILHTGIFIYYNKNTDVAVDRIFRVLRDDPHYSEDYYGGERILPFSAIISNVYNRDKDASDFLERRAQSTSANFGDLIQLAYQFHNQRDFENALKYFEQVPMKDVPDTKARFCYGSTLYYLKKFKPASEVFNDLARDTNTASLYFYLSDCLLRLGNEDSSYNTARAGLDYALDTIRYIESLSGVFYTGKYYHRSLQFLKYALNSRPADPSIFLGIGVNYQALDRADSAEKYFELVLKKDSTNSTALMGMVYVENAHGKYNAALERLKLIDKMHPQDAEVRYWMARTLFALGRNLEALKTCAEAINISPNFIKARSLAAELLYRQGHFSRAIEQWNQVLILDSNNAYALLGLAKSNDQLGNRIDAWSALNRWNKIQPSTSIDSETALLLQKYDLRH